MYDIYIYTLTLTLTGFIDRYLKLTKLSYVVYPNPNPNPTPFCDNNYDSNPNLNPNPNPIGYVNLLVTLLFPLIV
jgi:hypothetical protein